MDENMNGNENQNENKDKNINLTILNEIHKAAKMGMDSISYVSEKVSDEPMKECLTSQYSDYGNMTQKVNQAFEKYGEIPDEESMMTKVMGWTGVQMNTMTDASNSHIAEIMIQGNDMGIVACQKLINHNPSADQEVKNILNDFITFSKDNIEKMKEFL